MTDRSAHQTRVEEFMRKANQSLPDVPTVPSVSDIFQRANLLLEEFIEFIEAIGCTLHLDTIHGLQIVSKTLTWVKQDGNQDATLVPAPKIDMAETADALADMSVVLNGTASTFGINLEHILEEVDANNLAKFAEGHTFREDGKVIKPPNHVPPDITTKLKELGWNGIDSYTV